MTHSEEPRTAESGLLLPNETEYSFGGFMARNTPYCTYGAPKDHRIENSTLIYTFH